MKDDKMYLEHILSALHQIAEYVHNVDERTFLKNKMMQDAVIREFEVIGEASKRVSAETKNTYSEIPWKYMAGMRDKLIHDYIDVDLWIVFRTSKEDVPNLIRQVKEIV